MVLEDLKNPETTLKVTEDHHFYFNKQAIMLTNVDQNGLSFESQLPMKEDKKTGEMKRAASKPLAVTSLTDGERELTEFSITEYSRESYSSLFEYFEQNIKPFV